MLLRILFTTEGLAKAFHMAIHSKVGGESTLAVLARVEFVSGLLLCTGLFTNQLVFFQMQKTLVFEQLCFLHKAHITVLADKWFHISMLGFHVVVKIANLIKCHLTYWADMTSLSSVCEFVIVEVLVVSIRFMALVTLERS